MEAEEQFSSVTRCPIAIVLVWQSYDHLSQEMALCSLTPPTSPPLITGPLLLGPQEENDIEITEDDVWNIKHPSPVVLVHRPSETPEAKCYKTKQNVFCNPKKASMASKEAQL